MPEIRYSKRFEYLRVSRRVILPYLCVNILYMIVRGGESANHGARCYANNRPFLWSLADSELNILLNIRLTSYRFKEMKNNCQS